MRPDVTCRGCGGEGLTLILDLGEMPLANALLTEAALAAPEPVYPLELVLCERCSLVQITECVDPDLLFSDYNYFSSYSTTMLDHARDSVDRLIRERGLGSDDLAMEVASNDGYLLQYYASAGIPVLGIDPAANVVEAAEDRGVPTVCAFFGIDLGRQLRAKGRRADVLHANNVIAHVEDLNGFVAGIAEVLTEDGIAVIETPYVRDLVDGLAFDTIYHEHLYYHSLTGLDRVFRRNGLISLDVERIPIHGGSLRITAARAGTSEEPRPAIEALLTEEHEIGLDEAAYFRGFADRVHALRPVLVSLLAERRAAGRRIAAYGAAAKGAVLLNAFDIGSETLEFVADLSPHKQGRFMPGVHVPIVDARRLLADRPDDVVLLAWNFADEILEQQSEYRAQGGRFIIPVPEPMVV